jgi:hypothetical protein
MGSLVSDILPIATTGFGIATGNPALIASGVGMLGSQQAGQSTQQANQQVAQAGQFRPIGTTTRFGASNFQFDPSGRLSGAGYTLSPEALAAQNQLAGMTSQGLMQGQQLQGLASQYLGESPEAVRQRYVQQQTALLAPQQEQQLANLRNQEFQRGRSGLATGATQAGGLMATNPEMAAYYNAVAKQQAQIAAGADTAAQNQIKFGQGLAAGAYEPFKAGFGTMGQVEQAGQQALGLGSELGGQASSAARAVAPYQYQASAYNPVSNMLANPTLQNTIGGLLGGPSLNQAASDWMSANRDITPASTFSGSGDAAWMSDWWM